MRIALLVLAIPALAGCDWPGGDRARERAAAAAEANPLTAHSTTVDAYEAALAAIPPRPLPPQDAPAAIRVQALLLAPPLRPLPATLPTLRLPHEVSWLHFAGNAGIVVAEKPDAPGYSVLDLGTGETIATGDARNFASLSANGRLLVVPATDASDVIDAATGETLMTLPETTYYQVHWVGDAGVVHTIPDANILRGERLVYRDLANGLESSLAVIGPEIDAVLPTGDPDRWLLAGHGRLYQMALEAGPQGRVAAIVARSDWSLGAARDLRDFAGGRYHVSSGQDQLAVLDTVTGTQRIDAFPDYRVSPPLPTADPDVLLLDAKSRESPANPTPHRYVMSRRVLVPLPAGSVPPRVVYVPSLRMNAVIDGTSLAPFVVPTTVAGPVIAAANADDAGFVALREPVRARHGDLAAGALADVAAGARIVAVGVYEPKPRGGRVRVRVTATAQPVVLVLSSYEPVAWDVQPDPGVEVRAILVSGYYESTVAAAGVPVHRIGTVHAYQPGGIEESALAMVVRALTGAGIDEFHGAYASDRFILGDGPEVAAAAAEAAARTQRQEEAQAAEMRALTAPMPAATDRPEPRRADGEELPVDPAFAALADGARIVALGVYEPRPRGGNVRVQVLRTRGPVVLVLTSYEAVRWVLSVAPEADVRGVLVGSYYPSDVIGTRQPVAQIGRVWAFRRTDEQDVARLDAVVRRWTGHGVDSLEGEYATDNFTILQ